MLIRSISCLDRNEGDLDPGVSFFLGSLWKGAKKVAKKAGSVIAPIASKLGRRPRDTGK